MNPLFRPSPESFAPVKTRFSNQKGEHCLVFYKIICYINNGSRKIADGGAAPSCVSRRGFTEKPALRGFFRLFRGVDPVRSLSLGNCIFKEEKKYYGIS